MRTEDLPECPVCSKRVALICPDDLEKLRTRVAELEGALKYTEGIRSRTTEDIAKHNEELQNRLSTVEKELAEDNEVIDQLAADNVKLDKQLSTLLKASEGMAGAIDMLTRQIDAEGGKGYTVHALSDTAKSSLADFRAVKEGK